MLTKPGECKRKEQHLKMLIKKIEQDYSTPLNSNFNCINQFILDKDIQEHEKLSLQEKSILTGIIK